METVIVCCETIRDEMELACRLTGCRAPVHWVESGLHNVPAQLRERLQQELDRLRGVERVLLGFGFCGGSVALLQAGDYELILPRADDCITLMLGCPARRVADPQIYYLSRGWLRGEKNLWEECRYTLNKYGEKRGRSVIQMMLAQYRTLGVLDTGAYDLAALLPETQDIAQALGLRHQVVPASVDALRELLTGPWPPERFLTVPPRGKIVYQDLLTRH